MSIHTTKYGNQTKSTATLVISSIPELHMPKNKTIKPKLLYVHYVSNCRDDLITIKTFQHNISIKNVAQTNNVRMFVNQVYKGNSEMVKMDGGRVNRVFQRKYLVF